MTPSPRHSLARKRTALFALLVGLALLAFKWPLFHAAGDEKSSDAIPWRTDLQAATKEAKSVNKPLLLDFTASWCPPCRTMKRDVWPDPKVRSLVTDRFIPVLLDVDKPGSADAVNRYSIRTIPSILITDPDGTVLRRSGFLPRDQLLKFLQQD